MKIKRLFTEQGKNVFDMFEYEIREIKIKSHAREVEVPKKWSYNASNILGAKYMFKTETSIKEVIHRIVHAWTGGGAASGMFDTDEDQNAFYDEVCYMMLEQIAAPNSPQWFNTGINQYTLGGESDRYYVDTKTDTVKKSKHEYERPQLHACFIQSVDDNLIGENGIYELLTKEARIFKSGSGSGTNFSKIRSEGEPLSSGGVSSGLMSFLDIYDKSAKSIKSGGTTRRSAKMVILDADHPDIMKFIRWKTTEERKAAMLSYGSKRMQSVINDIRQMVNTGYTDNDVIANVDTELPANFVVNITRKIRMGNEPEIAEYDTTFESEVYNTVSGQSSNNTVRLPRGFITQARTEQSFKTRNRTNADTQDKSAAEILHEIAAANWETGDPGVHYEDNINFWNTCKFSGEIRASNPCSEYMFLDETACNLASINLAKFITDKQELDVLSFTHVVSLWAIVLDISVEIAHYPSAAIARNTHDYRTLGLGIANLGSALMLMGYPYGSPEAQAATRAICSLMTAQTYLTSADMACAIGTFTHFDDNKDDMLDVIHNHYAATLNKHIVGYEYTRDFNDMILPDAENKIAEIQDAAVKTWEDTIDAGNMYGFRNAQATLIAPTGTISFVMDCDTTGIEPGFSLISYKQLVGGGYIKSVNNTVPKALRIMGYHEDSVKEIVDGIINGDYTKFNNLPEHERNVFKTAMENYPGQPTLEPRDHLRMMAAAQPVISGAISKTVNVPNYTSILSIKNIFIQAHEMGLKSITVYRDKSKLSQPLSVRKHSTTEAYKSNKKFHYRGVKEPLPYRRSGGFTQKSEVSGHKLYVRTGEYADGRCGEVFIDMHKEGAVLHSLMNSFAIAVSLGLQHGVPLEEYVSAFVFSKSMLSGSVVGCDNIKMCSSIPDFIFRLLAIEYLHRYDLAHVKPISGVEDKLKKSLPDAVTEVVNNNYYTGDLCPSCGSFRMERSGTCSVCRDCGETTGCS